MFELLFGHFKSLAFFPKWEVKWGDKPHYTKAVKQTFFCPPPQKKNVLGQQSAPKTPKIKTFSTLLIWIGNSSCKRKF